MKAFEATRRFFHTAAEHLDIGALEAAKNLAPLFPRARRMLEAGVHLRVFRIQGEDLQAGARMHGEQPEQGELSALGEKASALTPVPGGVGPMTINTLIEQTVLSGEKSLV